MIFLISFLQLLIFQSDNDITGIWEQINNSRTGFREIMEFEEDSIKLNEEFFSRNNFETEKNLLRVVKTNQSGGEEIIIQSYFDIKNDSLILRDENEKLQDKMIRITSGVNNSLFGTWKGKTNKGVVTYLSLNEDSTSVYRAILRSEKFEYSFENGHIIVFAGDEPDKVKYKITNGILKMIYENTGEVFTYKRINNLE